MNILFVNVYYYPNLVGGTEHSLKLLGETLVGNGHNVYIYTLDGNGKNSFSNIEEINGVKVIRRYSWATWQKYKYNNRNVISKAIDFFHNYYHNRCDNDLKWIIKNKKVDIIHTNNCCHISYGIWKVADKLNIPVVHTLRDYWLIDPKAVIGESPISVAKIHQYYFKCLSNRYVKYVTAPSKKTIDLHKDYGMFAASKSLCVVNSIKLNYSYTIDLLNNKRNRTDNTFYILYVGSLIKSKGVDRLINFINNSRVDNIDYELHICGDGVLMDDLKYISRNNKRIIFHGKIDSEEMKNQYIRSDFIIVPSVWEEPFGRTVIEAAQYGNAVLSSNRGGLVETMRSLMCGLIFDIDCEESFVNSFAYMCNRKNIKKYISNICKNIYPYDITHQVNSFIGIYNDAIGSKRV